MKALSVALALASLAILGTQPAQADTLVGKGHIGAHSLVNGE